MNSKLQAKLYNKYPKIFADKDLNIWQKLMGSPNEYKKWSASRDAARELMPLLKDMGSYVSPFVIPEKPKKDLEAIAKAAKEAMEALKEFNSHSSLGYRGIGYGGREGADIKAYKPQFGTWKAKTPGIQSYGGMSQEMIDIRLENAKDIPELTDNIDALSFSFNTLGVAINGAASSWVSYIGGILSTIPQAIASIAALIIAKKAQSAAEKELAVSGAAAAVAGIPIIGPILAIAAMAAVLAAVLAIPKFAKGTNFAPGGLSLVGERGPELVNLPRGSQVIPNHKLGGSQDMLITKISGSQLDIILKRYYRSLASNT